MYDIDKEKYEKRANKTELENFLADNGLKLAWFATSSVLLRGQIGTTLETKFGKTLDIIDCQFMSVKSEPSINKFTIKLTEIYGWGVI